MVEKDVFTFLSLHVLQFLHVLTEGNMAKGDASAGTQQRFGRRNPNKEKPTGLTVEAIDVCSSYLLTSQRGPAASDAIG